MAQESLISTCPMAKACKGMMQSRFPGAVLVIPGIAFMALGLLIAVWPAVLPALVAAMCILAAVAMLLLAYFVRGIAGRFQRAGG